MDLYIKPDNISADDDTYAIMMYDSWGDGWHGNSIAINGQIFGEDFTSGSTSIAVITLDPGCYQVTVGMNDGYSALNSGSFQYEISWEIGDYSGGAPFNDELCFGGAEPEVGSGNFTSWVVYDIIMSDSYGDGWHGNSFAINGQVFGEDFRSGYSDYATVTLEPGCY